jgi:hypothetical protein
MLLKIKLFLCVYFTPFPQIIHEKSISHGNFAISGIGLGLIKTQLIFWIANFITATNFIIYKNNNSDFTFICVNGILLTLTSYMYIKSFILTNHLLNLLHLK